MTVRSARADMVGTVLCPTELHASGSSLVELAARLAQATESTLTLLHVADRGDFEVPSEVPVQVRETLIAFRDRIQASAAAAMEHLQAEQARCAQRGVRTHVMLESGRPWETIVRVADAVNPQLVVMGRHGEGQVSEHTALVLGSTAERVVRKSRMPVLVHAPVGPARGTAGSETLDVAAGTWVVGIDFSDASIEAARYADRLARATGAELHLVHGVQTEDLLAEEVALYGTVGWHPSLLDWCVTRSQHKLESVAETLPSVRGTHVVREGTATDSIIQTATRLRASLAVVGTHGRRGIAEWVLGTTAERVLRRHTGSVLCVPPPPVQAGR
jgi:nucleotide-binding universal stress UspA family protein